MHRRPPRAHACAQTQRHVQCRRAVTCTHLVFSEHAEGGCANMAGVAARERHTLSIEPTGKKTKVGDTPWARLSYYLDCLKSVGESIPSSVRVDYANAAAFTREDARAVHDAAKRRPPSQVDCIFEVGNAGDSANEFLDVTRESQLDVLGIDRSSIAAASIRATGKLKIMVYEASWIERNYFAPMRNWSLPASYSRYSSTSASSFSILPSYSTNTPSSYTAPSSYTQHGSLFGGGSGEKSSSSVPWIWVVLVATILASVAFLFLVGRGYVRNEMSTLHLIAACVLGCGSALATGSLLIHVASDDSEIVCHLFCAPFLGPIVWSIVAGSAFGGIVLGTQPTSWFSPDQDGIIVMVTIPCGFIGLLMYCGICYCIASACGDGCDGCKWFIRGTLISVASLLSLVAVAAAITFVFVHGWGPPVIGFAVFLFFTSSFLCCCVYSALDDSPYSSSRAKHSLLAY